MLKNHYHCDTLEAAILSSDHHLLTPSLINAPGTIYSAPFYNQSSFPNEMHATAIAAGTPTNVATELAANKNATTGLGAGASSVILSTAGLAANNNGATGLANNAILSANNVVNVGSNHHYECHELGYGGADLSGQSPWDSHGAKSLVSSTVASFPQLMNSTQFMVKKQSEEDEDEDAGADVKVVLKNDKKNDLHSSVFLYSLGDDDDDVHSKKKKNKTIRYHGLNPNPVSPLPPPQDVVPCFIPNKTSPLPTRHHCFRITHNTSPPPSSISPPQLHKAPLPLPPSPSSASASAPQRKGTPSYRQTHINSERQRRKAMSNLFATLHSLLPRHGPVKLDRCTIINYVIDYVEALQERVKDLARVRSKLELKKKRQQNIRLMDSIQTIFQCDRKVIHRENQNEEWETKDWKSFQVPLNVTVRYWGTMDIFITLSCPKRRGLWSNVLKFLEEAFALDVQSVTFSSTTDVYLNFIYAKVIHIHQKLTTEELQMAMLDYLRVYFKQ